ncbi:MAG: hypothetical protein DRP74_00235 [Candidatus Omnitrophota bacterium]|nr:MAG: hypothetical protein DRP74_00235 [Candidatus Omnitrophota bacterium]
MRKRKTAPAIIPILIAVFLSGCLKIEPTYTKEKIVDSVISLCLTEYNIEPKVWLLEDTLWIYIPVSSLITSNLQLDQETFIAINKVMLGASRVVLSMKPRPQFIVVVASDTQQYGLDYMITTWIPDIVKYQLQLISRDEFGRRNLIEISEDAKALGDEEGRHLEKKDINFWEFLSLQISQRIRFKFTLDPKYQDYFKLGEINSEISGNTFRIKAYIEKIKALPDDKINVQKEIAKIVFEVIKAYEIKDYLLIDIENTATGKKALFTKSELVKLLR